MRLKLTDLPQIIQLMMEPELEPRQSDFTAHAFNYSKILPSYKLMEIISLCKLLGTTALNSALAAEDPSLNFAF